MFNIIIGILQLLGAAAIIWFWYEFFTKENKNPTKSEAYMIHERSFPIADLGWVVPTLIIGAIGNFFNDKFGILFTLISGGALVMLGALDLVFALQSCKRGVKEGDVGLSVVVLVGGIVAVIYGLLNF